MTTRTLVICTIILTVILVADLTGVWLITR